MANIKSAKKVGADFKNDLCNGMLKFFPDHFEDESKFCPSRLQCDALFGALRSVGIAPNL